jgi:hypothetical protein
MANCQMAKAEVLEGEVAIDNNLMMLTSVKTRLARLEADRNQDPNNPAGELKKARIKEAALLRDIESARTALIHKKIKLYRMELEFQNALFFSE